MRTIKTIKTKITCLLVVIMFVFASPVQGLNLQRSMSSPDISENLPARHSFSEGGNLNLNLNFNLDLTNYTIQFSSRELRLKQALDELFLHKEFNIVYGSKEIDVDVPIVFTSRTLKLSEALKQIEKQAPVEFVIDGKHIIVKKRKLETGYFLKGRVVDAATHEGLVAANVYIAGTTTGVVTDHFGNFTMHLAPGTYQLIFRYVGYVEQSIKVNLFQDVQLNLAMTVKENQLQAVDVTGSFSVIENIERGRTIETIDSKVIGKLNTNNVNDALHGRINGVWNTKTSGAPGDHHKIRIRGISSIMGSTDPVYIVDGAIIPIVNFDNLGISDLNTHDIKRITVLKDASSTALYGNMGGNGVILIETKNGGGKSKISFEVKQGVQRFDQRYDLMKAEEFYATLHDADQLIATQFYTINKNKGKYELYPEYFDSTGTPLSETDFQEKLFQLGKVNEYQLSGSGTYKTIDYYISGNYFDHNGVLVNTNYKKYSLTANFSKAIKDKGFVQLMYKTSRQENLNTLDVLWGNNVILHGINYEPSYYATPDSFLRKKDRLYYNDNTMLSLNVLSTSRLPPDSLFYGDKRLKTENAQTINIQSEYLLKKNLTARANASFSYRDIYFTTFSISDHLMRKRYIRSHENYIFSNAQFDLEHQSKFKAHMLNSLLRFRSYFDQVYWEVDSLLKVNYTGIKPEDGLFQRGSQALYGEQGDVSRSINSLVLNANYNYKQKYFVSLIGNLEGLKEGHYVMDYDWFGSLALNYDLSREEVLSFPEWINSFNVYFNYGKSGNYPLNSLSDDIYSVSSTYTANGETVPGAGISNLANKGMRPEKVLEADFGLKISILDNRISMNADYFRKTNSDLIILRSTPIYYGGGFNYNNVGELKNSGVELTLDLIPIDTDHTYWESKFGFSSNHQYIHKLAEGLPISFNNTDVLIPDFYVRENELLGNITGFRYLGLWKDYYDPEYRFKHPDYIHNLGLAYERNDTVMQIRVSEANKTIIGNSIPNFTFNWLNYFEFKNFSVDMVWYGVAGVDKYNATRAATFITGLNLEVSDAVTNKLQYLKDNVFYESSFFVEDASFIRLKTLRFAYHHQLKRWKDMELEYSLSLENFITLTHYSGYDPEAAIYTNNNFTDNAIDRGAYPNPKGIYFSINLKL